MIANFFNSAKPINVLFLSGFLILIFIAAQINVEFDYFSLKSWTVKGLDLLLLLSVFFLYNFIIAKNKLTLNNNYALLFICLSLGLFFPFVLESNFLLSLLFLAFAFRRIYSLRTNASINEKLFDSALWIALASFLYIENSYFIVLIYGAIISFQRVKWNYFVIPIVGFVLPYFLVYVYALTINDFTYFNKISQPHFSFNIAVFSDVLNLSYIAVLIALGGIGYIINTVKTSEFSIEFRALWSILLVHFLLGIFLVFTGDTFSINKAVYLTFPFGIISTNYIQTVSKKWLKELLVYSFFALTLGSIIYNFIP